MQDKKNRRNIISEFNIRLLRSYLYIVVAFLSIFIINFIYEIFTKIHFNWLICDFSFNVFFFKEDSVFYVPIELITTLCIIIILLFLSKVLIINFLFCVSKYVVLSYVIYFLHKLCVLCVDSFYTTSDYFTIFSVVISMLSAVVAALTIMFGNFKICGIGSNTILKHIFGKQFLYCRAVIFISPLVMLVLIFGGFKYSYFVLFVLSIISLIYLLHLCISVFVDIGIRTKVIPEYISDEVFDELKRDSSISESGKYLYGEFIHSFNNDEFNNFSEVYINLFIIIVNKCKALQKQSKQYKNVYIFLNDTKKYLIRNSTEKDDVLKYYFELCSLLVDKIKCNDIVYLAIFQNVIECSNLDEGNTELRKMEIDKFFEKLFCCFQNKFSKLKFSFFLLFQIEAYISDNNIYELSDIICNRIDDILENVFNENVMERYFKSSSDLLCQRDQIKSTLFNLYGNVYYIKKNSRVFYQSGMLSKSIINVWNDLCSLINKTLFFSPKQHNTYTEIFFAFDNSFLTKNESQIYVIYKLKKLGEKHE